jgi:hypothetical protein
MKLDQYIRTIDRREDRHQAPLVRETTASHTMTPSKKGMSMRYPQMLLSVAGLALTLGFVGSASARDGTIYPGSMCIPVSGGTRAITFGAIANTSATSAMSLDCPVVRQETERPIDPTSWVRLIDLHPTNNITCEIWATEFLSLTSGGFWSSGPQSTTGFGTHTQVLSFPGVGASNLAHETLSCTLPVQQSGHSSHLATYKIEENS